MKIFLDSSFFFPLINVNVEKVSSQHLNILFQKSDHNLYRSTLTSFEIAAKGAKYVKQKLLSFEDLSHGLLTLHHQPNIIEIPIYYSEILHYAIYFNRNHTDFIDCILLASSLVTADIFLTLDEELISKSEKIWRKEINTINSKFQILYWKEFVHSI